MRARDQVATMAAAVLLVGAGCRPATTCDEHGDACGGDPVGPWALITACRDPASSPPQQGTNLGQPATAAREGAAPATGGDWCSGLTYGPNGVTAFVFAHDALAVSGGTLTYASDGTYQATLNTRGQATVDLSAVCMTRFGLGLTCEGLAAGLIEVAAVKPAKPITLCTDSPSDAPACGYYNSYDSIRCTDDSRGGCVCSYGVSFAGSFAGTWKAQGGILTHADQSHALPMATDYCVEAGGAGGPDVLSLWGHNGAPIFGEAGLHQLGLQRQP